MLWFLSSLLKKCPIRKTYWLCFLCLCQTNKKGGEAVDKIKFNMLNMCTCTGTQWYKKQTNFWTGSYSGLQNVKSLRISKYQHVFWQISVQNVNVWFSLACVCRVCFLHYSSWCLESEFPAHGLCLRWARACNAAAAIQEIFFVAPFWLTFCLTPQLYNCIMMWTTAVW